MTDANQHNLPRGGRDKDSSPRGEHQSASSNERSEHESVRVLVRRVRNGFGAYSPAEVHHALAALTELEEQLETLREAVKWVLHTDVWIDDNPFHGPTLEPNGTTKTQVWDNLRAAYDAGSNPASEPVKPPPPDPKLVRWASGKGSNQDTSG